MTLIFLRWGGGEVPSPWPALQDAGAGSSHSTVSRSRCPTHGHSRLSCFHAAIQVPTRCSPAALKLVLDTHRLPHSQRPGPLLGAPTLL